MLLSGKDLRSVKKEFSVVVGKNAKLNDFSDRLDRYSAAKKKSIQVGTYLKNVGNEVSESGFDLVKMEMRSRAAQVLGCGSYLHFRHYTRLDDTRLIAANFCKKHLLCQLCAIRRGGKYLRVSLPKILHVIEKEKLRPYLVTFTIQNGENLGERLNHLKRGLSKFVRRKLRFERGESKRFSESCKIEGSIYSIELKEGAGSRLWHPHAHMIALCSSEIDKYRLSEEWQEITGDSKIVDVRPITDRKNDLPQDYQQEDITDDSLIGGLCEVFKYAVKFSSMPYHRIWEAYSIVQGKRLIGKTGLLHGLKLPEGLLDDVLPDDEPFIDLYFSYLWGRGYVIES